MNTDEIKDMAIAACKHWFALDVEDMRDHLPVGLTLVEWKPRENAVHLKLRAMPGHNFEIWAHKHWKWDGMFSVHVSWLPPGEVNPAKRMFPHDVWEADYEIDKKPGQRPYVLDCREGQVWMKARET